MSYIEISTEELNKGIELNVGQMKRNELEINYIRAIIELEKIKSNNIPISVIQNKLSEIDEKIKNYKSLQELHELQAQKFILELILKEGNK